TILVTGGGLKLRGDTVQESTGYPQAAFLLAGGALDLGTAADPGGNTVSVNGVGALLVNLTPGLVPAEGDTSTVNGKAVYPLTGPVRYRFSGFLPPLQPGGSYTLGSPLAIKFRLTDNDGGAATRLSAVTSLKVQALDAQGSPLAPPFDPASADGKGLFVQGG